MNRRGEIHDYHHMRSRQTPRAAQLVRRRVGVRLEDGSHFGPFDCLALTCEAPYGLYRERRHNSIGHKLLPITYAEGLAVQVHVRVICRARL